MIFSSISPSEIKHFENFSSQWWDEEGPFAMLHRLNPLRIQYIKDQVSRSFHGLSILDVGCGGGVLSEPLARLGAQVTGLDASEKNISVASLHAQEQGLPITYVRSSLEDYLATSHQKFDLVIALEVLEHVQNPFSFLEECTSCLKEDGLLFVSTFHRTIKSYILGIVFAEYILKWVPKNTHHWRQFIKPSEIYKILSPKGFMFKDLVGVKYDIRTSSWVLSEDIDVNYMGVLMHVNSS